MIGYLVEAFGGKKKAGVQAQEKAQKKHDAPHPVDFIDASYSGSEIVIGLVGAVGTNLKAVSEIISERLAGFQYETKVVRISKDIISSLGHYEPGDGDEFSRINSAMDEGSRLRRETKDNSFLALCAASKIREFRDGQQSGNEEEKGRPLKNQAFVVRSLKHPAEVARMKNIYSGGFYLLGVHSGYDRRLRYLNKDLRIKESQAEDLIIKDSKESDSWGQHTSDTFHLSDFFVSDDGDGDKLKQSIWRVLDLIFGNPYVTPTFDEYAMFMAFSASLRSADLSRQVGSVVAKNDSILATGANDVPKAGGGLYWPVYNEKEKGYSDVENGRDFMRGKDSNAAEKESIIDSIVQQVPEDYREEFKRVLGKSKIKDITEYGRVVHAEMDSLLACARNSISTQDATLYCTTFPCHNCAKHIVASGINRVVYVQPYDKSKASQFHDDSISFSSNSEEKQGLVAFEPFIGVGPRSFFNLFSMDLGSGYPLSRKDSDGRALEWSQENGRVRSQLLPCSYIEREKLAAGVADQLLENINEQQ